MTNPTTVPTAHGPVAMVPGRRGCGSAPGRRAARVSGRILAPERSRMRGHSERSLYATGRAVILKPTAVGCRVGMSGLRNKAICDEIRKFGYPISWLKPPPPACWYGGEMVELLWFSVAIPPSRASRMLPVIRLDSPDTRSGPYRPEPESDLGLRWSRRPCRPCCAEGDVHPEGIETALRRSATPFRLWIGTSEPRWHRLHHSVHRMDC